MHEFEQFVHDRLQELPVGFQKSRILANDIHDVAGYNGFIVFSTLHFRQPKKILDDSHEEALLSFLVHGSRYRSYGPAQRIAIRPGPFGAINLLGQFFGHDALGIDHVEMREIYETFSARLVQLNCVALLDEFSDDFALLILHYQDFFRSHHFLYHDCSQVRKNFCVFMLA